MTLQLMHASEIEVVDLASYRLKKVAVLWYESWETSRGPDAPPAVWEEFAEALLTLSTNQDP